MKVRETLWNSASLKEANETTKSTCDWTEPSYSKEQDSTRGGT